MQPEPEAAAKHQAAQAAAMLPALGLQEQQEEVITVIYRLHCDIVSIIHAERQQLQQQMTQLEVGLGSSKAHTASSAVACDPDQLGDRPEQLQRQQSLANRLQVLLHKEYWLRAIANIFLFGSLTYEQMSKLSVLSWPFGMRPFCVGVAIMQQRESRDQQLLQCAG
jgi:hypothetical protein